MTHTPYGLLLAAALAIALSLLVFARTARADADAGADASGENAPIEPPRSLSHDEPPYPEGQTTAATVVVEVVVEADGTASDARVVEGSEPFASAARDESRTCSDCVSQGYKSLLDQLRARGPRIFVTR